MTLAESGDHAEAAIPWILSAIEYASWCAVSEKTAAVACAKQTQRILSLSGDHSSVSYFL